MCQRYADMERKLGEIDRARAIYVHCSQICDPKVNNIFRNVNLHKLINHKNRIKYQNKSQIRNFGKHGKILRFLMETKIL